MRNAVQMALSQTMTSADLRPGRVQFSNSHSGPEHLLRRLMHLAVGIE